MNDLSEPAVAASHRLHSTRLRSWPQRIVHLLGIALGWAIFVWSWHKVLGYPWDSAPLWRLIIGAFVVVPSITVAWTVHNLNIHRKKGPRRSSRRVLEAYATDWNERVVDADWERLATAASIVIGVDGNRKRYQSEDAAVPVVEPAAATWTPADTALRPDVDRSSQSVDPTPVPRTTPAELAAPAMEI